MSDTKRSPKRSAISQALGTVGLIICGILGPIYGVELAKLALKVYVAYNLTLMAILSCVLWLFLLGFNRGRIKHGRFAPKDTPAPKMPNYPVRALFVAIPVHGWVGYLCYRADMGGWAIAYFVAVALQILMLTLSRTFARRLREYMGGEQKVSEEAAG